MGDFKVKVRNLETGETLIAEMEDSAQCMAWLEERPHFIEIISVLSDVSPAESRRLKEAMRPYNKAELALKAKYDQELVAAMEAQYKEELELIQREQKSADGQETDPDAVMSIKYDADDGLVNVEDGRPITDAARGACEAWVRERNAWVASKGQLIGEAHLEVYPGALPDGVEERVLEGGRFFPRLKPEN